MQRMGEDEGKIKINQSLSLSYVILPLIYKFDGILGPKKHTVHWDKLFLKNWSDPGPDH